MYNERVTSLTPNYYSFDSKLDLVNSLISKEPSTLVN